MTEICDLKTRTATDNQNPSEAHVLKKAVSPAYKSGEKKERNKLIISKGRYARFTESTRVCSC